MADSQAYTDVMSQAHDMNQNLWSLPQQPNSFMEALMLGMNAIRPGMPLPRPGIGGPAITGGGSPFYGDTPPNSAGALVRNPSVRGATEVNRANSYDPIVQALNPANANTRINTRAHFGNVVPDAAAVDAAVSSRFPLTAIEGGRNHPDPTVRAITNWMGDSNVPIQRIENRGGTHYVVATDNANRPVWVRVPADTHVGRPARGTEVGNRFDTGSELVDPRHTLDPRTTTNISGQPYSNLDNLLPALQNRFSAAPGNANWLTSPDQAPVYRQAPVRTQEILNTLRDPSQLDLFKGRTPMQLPPDRTTVIGARYGGPDTNQNNIAPSTAYNNSITYQRLSPHHQNIVAQHLLGRTNAEIARDLSATGYTTAGQVSSYIQNVLRKVPNR